MFGYLIPDASGLTKEQKEAYRARYCGLCRAIGARYGSFSRSALSYEMTFLALLLDHLDGTEPPPPARCIKHPFRKKNPLPAEDVLPHLAYAADLTVLLLCAKLRDDVADDHSRTASALLDKFKSQAARARAYRPEEADMIDAALSLLAEMEQKNELRPDLPAGCFGDLVGKLLAFKAESEKEACYRLGFALGKLLYLMDATSDLYADLKKERYNALVCTTEAFREEMLDVLSEDLLTALEALPEGPLTPILNNILTSGIWTRFSAAKSKRKQPKHENETNAEGRKQQDEQSL